MTRDEIKLVIFIMAALFIGALYQDWRGKNPLPPPTPALAVSKKWAKPPYVFKTRKELEQATKNVEAEDRDHAPRAVESQE